MVSWNDDISTNSSTSEFGVWEVEVILDSSSDKILRRTGAISFWPISICIL